MTMMLVYIHLLSKCQSLPQLSSTYTSPQRVAPNSAVSVYFATVVLGMYRN